MTFQIPPFDFGNSSQPFRTIEKETTRVPSTPTHLDLAPRPDATEVDKSPTEVSRAPGPENTPPRYSILCRTPSIGSNGDTSSERASLETIRPPTLSSIRTPSSKYKARNKLQKKFRSPESPLRSRSPTTTARRHASIRSRCRSILGRLPTFSPMTAPPAIFVKSNSPPKSITFDDEESLPRSSMATCTTEYSDTASQVSTPVETVASVRAKDTLNSASFYRCEIHASCGTEQRAMEGAYKSLILSAGGKVLDCNTVFVGGFLFEMPIGVMSPLVVGDRFGASSCILVMAWERFDAPQFDGLRLHPLTMSNAADRFSCGSSDTSWYDI